MSMTHLSNSAPCSQLDLFARAVPTAFAAPRSRPAPATPTANTRWPFPTGLYSAACLTVAAVETVITLVLLVHP